jgi:hypothetical protein
VLVALVPPAAHGPANMNAAAAQHAAGAKEIRNIDGLSAEA